MRVGNGDLHIAERKHECIQPGTGYHRTFYYQPTGNAAHIRPGDRWRCDCGRWWVAGTDFYGYHKWYSVPGSSLYSRLKGWFRNNGNRRNQSSES